MIDHVCNVVLLRHNSPDVKERLKEMGFAELRWTVSSEPEQILFSSSFHHTVKGVSQWPGDKVPDKEYNGSYWNGGIAEPKGWSNVFDAGDDEELFLSMSERLIKEEKLYFDGDWVLVENPQEVEWNWASMF